MLFQKVNCTYLKALPLITLLPSQPRLVHVGPMEPGSGAQTGLTAHGVPISRAPLRRSTTSGHGRHLPLRKDNVCCSSQSNCVAVNPLCIPHKTPCRVLAEQTFFLVAILKRATGASCKLPVFIRVSSGLRLISFRSADYSSISFFLYLTPSRKIPKFTTLFINRRKIDCISVFYIL